MTLLSSPHPKESAALSLGQVKQGSEIVKIKEFATSSGNAMPSSATSFASDGSEDAGFEDGCSMDVDMAEDETEGIQIQCIQTLTELEPNNELKECTGSPLMSDCKTPIPLPPPPIHIGSGAYGGNQAYVNIQNSLPRIMERPSSPMQSYWGSNASNDTQPSRAPGDVGLTNIGNTCFMNSGLQCLVHTSPLVEFFVRSETYEKTTTSLVYQFNSLMNHVWFGDKGAISLHDFKLVLGNKYGQFKDCRQHDCQEFLAVMLDMLHEELKSKQKSASLVDSSVVDCIEDSLVSEKGPDTQNVNLSIPLAVYSDDIVTQSSNKVVEKCPLNKRLKLDNNDGCDSASEAGINFESKECSEVRRKSPLSKLEMSHSYGTQTKEAEEILTVESNENEAGENSDQSTLGESQAECPIQKAQTYWNKYMKENNTVIASTFQGMFKSAVTCSVCSFISETYEPFMYLSLPIPRVMEKQLNVTFISMKDRSQTRTEITVHLMGTVGTLIQEVVKTQDNCVLGSPTKYAAAEVFNHRVSRILEEKLQLRNLSTNSRNIYVYELNSNFDDDNNGVESTEPTLPMLEKQQCIGLSASDNDEHKPLKPETCISREWKPDESTERNAQIASSSRSATPSYTPLGAPVGGGLYDVASSSMTQGASSSIDDITLPQDDNDNFNRVQCNICLEDYTRGNVMKHKGCSCVLCKDCLQKSVEHYQSEGEQTQDAEFLRCAVCLQVVSSKKTFISLDQSCTNSSPPEFIMMSILFRNDPGTDANNNSSWSPGLFGYPWIIRVPSYLNATDLVEYIESINPAPGVNHRLLSVKSDGKSCGQCVFSTRCSGCEIPKEGMISLNSCNSILISFIDLPSERMEQMQPPDMILHNELSPSWQYNRQEEPTIDIHDCLRTFSETEHLDEQNPWFCPRCEKNQRATKALSICKFPDYLIIYLKRFVFLDQSSNKLNNRLMFPINDLDVSDYVTEGFGANIGKYNLYSCVCHFGSASAGHYTAYAKNPVTNQWHYFNDESIGDRAPGDNEYASAYVLFYEKQGMGCNIPTKCSRPLPDLNSFSTSTTSTFGADTRGSYLPAEPSVTAGPVRAEGDFSEMNLQVDSTSPNFSFPHTSSEADLLDVDEGVGNETNHLAEIRDGLGVQDTDSLVVTSSTTGVEGELIKNESLDFDHSGAGDNAISTSTEDDELPSSSVGGADSTSNE